MKTKQVLFLMFIFTTILILCARSYAQNYYRLEGNIVDSQSKPVGFANISINNTSIGTISNVEGEFVFNVAANYINDSIIISHIGYTTKSFKIDTINKDALNIKLSEKTYSLEEIVVSPIEAFSLIQKVIKLIPDNYSAQEFESQGFYREVISENQNYIEYAEAILCILHKPYKANEKGQELDLIKVIESRRNKNDLGEYQLSKKVKNPIGGPVSCLKYNSVKFHPSFLKPTSDERYSYKLTDIIEYMNRELYVIDFDQKNDVKKSLYQGRIYIDKESLAIVHLNYHKSPKGIKYALPGGLPKAVLKMFKMSMEGFDKRVMVNYKLINDKWFLSSIIYKEKASFIRKGIPYDLISTKDFLITQVNNRIENSYLNDEVLKSGEFKNQVGEYHEDFWGNYNIIPINKELEIQFVK